MRICFAQYAIFRLIFIILITFIDIKAVYIDPSCCFFLSFYDLNLIIVESTLEQLAFDSVSLVFLCSYNSYLIAALLNMSYS